MTRTKRSRARRLTLGVLVFVCGGMTEACAQDATRPDLALPDADLRVLFLGNSLTYTHDVPAMVQTIVEAAGRTMARAAIVDPGVSLEDHWNRGRADAVRDLRADVVVLQQGPSSLPENQEHLRRWAERFAPVVRESGGTPALYMVWPDTGRRHAFADVFDAYRGAADAVDGLFLPAGDAWQRAWAMDSTLAFYGPDGFHPSVLGSQTAALAIARVLLDEPLDGLPARLEPTTPGLPVVDFGDAADVIRAAVEAAVTGKVTGASS